MKGKRLVWFFLIVVGCAARTPQPGVVAFLSDFSIVDDAAGVCKGVMLAVESRIKIVDITHQVTPYSIADGARFLANVAPYFPTGTVFLAVVDPGVGSSRRPMVAKSRRGHFYVLPDNGLITLVAMHDGLEAAREIRNPAWAWKGTLSSTFHGRDIFAPVAARLAGGGDWTQVGPVIEKPVQIGISKGRITEQGIEAEAIAIDGEYGNVILNVEYDVFERLGYERGEKIKVALGGRTVEVTVARTFSEVPLGQGLLYRDSTGRVALALNQDHFARRYRVKPPVRVFLPQKN